MSRLFTLILLFFAYQSLTAQDSIVILHPTLGDTITKAEKAQFLLFPEIDDQTFDFGQIHMENGSYVLKVYHDGKLQKFETTQKKLEENQLNVAILNSYEKKGNNSSSLVRKNQQMDTTKLNTNYLTPEMKRQILLESNRVSDLRNDAEIRGLRGADKTNYIQNSGHFEIQLNKKK